jgi:hypothetical protein
MWLVAMSHHTTSWKSPTSTWRWTAGKAGRSPAGGKARRIGGRPALARQKTVGQHDQRAVPMQTIPAPALLVVPATRALGVFIERLDGPAAMGQLDQPLQRRVRGQVTVIPLDLAAFARQRTLAEPLALRARADAGRAGGALGAPRRPMHPHGHQLFAQDHVVVLAPGDGLPAVRRQGIPHGLGLIERGGPRPRGRGGDLSVVAQTSSGKRSPQVLLTPTT